MRLLYSLVRELHIEHNQNSNAPCGRFFVGGNVFAMVEIMNFWQSLWPVVKICVFFCRFTYNTSYVVI